MELQEWIESIQGFLIQVKNNRTVTVAVGILGEHGLLTHLPPHQSLCLAGSRVVIVSGLYSSQDHGERSSRPVELNESSMC